MDKNEKIKRLFGLFVLLAFFAFYIASKDVKKESNNTPPPTGYSSSGVNEGGAFRIDSQNTGEINNPDEQTSELSFQLQDGSDITTLSSRIKLINEYVCYKEIRNGKTFRFSSPKYAPFKMEFFMDQAAPLIEESKTLEIMHYTSADIMEADVIGANNVNPPKSYHLMGKNSLDEYVYFYGYKNEYKQTDMLIFVTPDFQMFKRLDPSDRSIIFYRTRYYYPHKR